MSIIKCKVELEKKAAGKFTLISGEHICEPPMLPELNPEACQTIEFPNLNPCFYLKWGDGRQDQIETEDFEVMYLAACNPFKNVTYRNLCLSNIQVIHADGTPVENLPNGTPGGFVVPSCGVCFEVIEPCSCCFAEIALKTCGLPEGKYCILFTYCIGEIALSGNHDGEDKFQLSFVHS